jgi:histidyl-tRNA synthetase
MNRLPQPVKLYYVEHMFRYDRPQRGRVREHHQFGCEALGVGDAYVDVEIISLLVQFFDRVGLRELDLEINSIGDKTCRPAYIADLVEYLQSHVQDLPANDRERLERNPLRILDTKETSTQQILEGAPSIVSYLCDACKAHFEKLQHGLRILGIDFTVNPRLVRGLDYYNRSVFEFLSPREGAQSAVTAGGRYDPLAEALGGPATPGIGFGMGIERVILAMEAYDIRVPAVDRPSVFVAHIGETTEDEALRETHKLRRKGVSAIMDFGMPGLKTQLRHASSAGSALAVIIGEDELKSDSVTVKPMSGAPEQTIPRDQLVPVVDSLLP